MSVSSTEDYTDSNFTDDASIDYDEEFGVLFTIYYYFYDVDAIFSLVTVFLGTLTFILIPKWRNFRNYAFLNMFLANGVYFFMWGNIISFEFFFSNEGRFIFFTSLISMSLWQVLAAYSFYINVVKIFSFHSSRIYLYATICAWIVPIPVIACHMIFINEDDDTNLTYVQIVPSAINLLLYLRVLYVLVLPVKIRTNTSSTCRRIYIATFIFLITGVMTTMTILIGNRIEKEPKFEFLPDVLYVLQMFISKVLFLVLKTHRTLWMETVKRWRSRRDSINTVSTVAYSASRRTGVENEE